MGKKYYRWSKPRSKISWVVKTPCHRDCLYLAVFRVAPRMLLELLLLFGCFISSLFGNEVSWVVKTPIAVSYYL